MHRKSFLLINNGSPLHGLIYFRGKSNVCIRIKNKEMLYFCKQISKVVLTTLKRKVYKHTILRPQNHFGFLDTLSQVIWHL